MKFIESIKSFFKKTESLIKSPTYQQMTDIINIIDNDNDPKRSRESTRYANLYLISDGVFISMDTARIVYCDDPNEVRSFTFCDVFVLEEEMNIVKAFKRREKRFDPDFSKVVIK